MGLSLLVPFPTTVVPAWELQVIGPTGQPVSGVRVREHWQDYSVESNGDQEDAQTDDQGHVRFPKRRVWAPALWRLLGPMLNTVMYGVHAGFGPHSSVGAWSDKMEGWLYYRPGSVPPPELILKPRRSIE